MNTCTEEEAKTKWCPHARVGFTGAAGNRYSMDIDKSQASPFAVCIGSACMSWRWESFASRDNPTRAPGAGQSFDMTRGYCGLAGRP